MPSKPAPKLCPGCDQPMLPKGVKKKPMQYDHAQGCPLDPKAKRKPVPSDTDRLDALESLIWNGDVRIYNTCARTGINFRDSGTHSLEESGDDLRAAIDAAMRAARRKR